MVFTDPEATGWFLCKSDDFHFVYHVTHVASGYSTLLLLQWARLT